jgi:ribose 5-phosphate isomerase RpiB
VARAVADGRAERGVLVCGTGIGMCISANKVEGIRAAKVNDPYEAKMARAHNDANVICFGARVLDPSVMDECLRVFLETPFEGGRHARRVDKMMHPAAAGRDGLLSARACRARACRDLKPGSGRLAAIGRREAPAAGGTR